MTTENLLIIGNGFDLSSGLRSSYTNFFESNLIKKKNVILEEYYTNAEYFKNMTPVLDEYVIKKDLIIGFVEQNVYLFQNPQICFWNLIFRNQYSKHPSWNNIEQKIEDIVCNSPLIRNNAEKILSAYYNMETALGNIILSENDMFNFELAVYIMQNKTGKQDIYDFLLEELKIFELQFCAYLSKEVANNEFYQSNVKKLLNKFNLKSSNVINFNYTTIKGAENVKFESNVHGSLKNRNIIFGIDLANLDKLDKGLKFSKTYRKMHAFEEVTINYYNPESLLSRSIERISFYGHSLNSSDYSYFQSIFDFYEVYSSGISLVFYYSIYDDRQTKLIKESYTNAVINLLNTYGETMANKYHGKNFLHKLMLENRVILKEI